MWGDETRRSYKVLVGKQKGKLHLEELGIDERMVLKLIFMAWDGGRGLV